MGNGKGGGGGAWGCRESGRDAGSEEGLKIPLQGHGHLCNFTLSLVLGTSPTIAVFLGLMEYLFYYFPGILSSPINGSPSWPIMTTSSAVTAHPKHEVLPHAYFLFLLFFSNFQFPILQLKFEF
jgi:hypothetical protein